MNTLQIKYFLSIVENKTFSKASEVNYITQPTLSKHIKKLEEELDVVLFDRTKNPIELTPIGKIYHKIFSDFVKEMDHANKLALKQKLATNSSLKIGMISAWQLPEHVLRKIAAFRANYPDIYIEFENHSVKDLLEKIRDGSINACFTLTDFVKYAKDISLITLGDIKKYLLYSDVFYPDNQDIQIQDFKKEQFFCLGNEKADPTRYLMEEYCKYYGFFPMIKSLPNIDSVISNVEFGNGVTILDELTQYPASKHIKSITFEQNHTLCFAWNADYDSLSIRLLREQLAKP